MFLGHQSEIHLTNNIQVPLLMICKPEQIYKNVASLTENKSTGQKHRKKDLEEDPYKSPTKCRPP